jgi:hypothetical protein
MLRTIARLLYYFIALSFAPLGIVFALFHPESSVRLWGVIMTLASLVLLPVTRGIVLSKYGISIGGLLAIGLFVSVFFGFALVPDDPRITASDTQTIVTNDSVKVDTSLNNTRTSTKEYNITTELEIKRDGETVRTIEQQSNGSIAASQKRRVNIVDIRKKNSNNSDVRVELRNKNGYITSEKVINKSYWQAIQRGSYSVSFGSDYFTTPEKAISKNMTSPQSSVSKYVVSAVRTPN